MAGVELDIEIDLQEDMSRPDGLSVELYEVYDILYDQVVELVDGGNEFGADSKSVKILVKMAMTVVENFKKGSEAALNGASKRSTALSLIKYVLKDLAGRGKLDAVAVARIIDGLDFWGGMVMDVAVDAAKKLFDVGHGFVDDVKEGGCKSACRKTCILI